MLKFPEFVSSGNNEFYSHSLNTQIIRRVMEYVQAIANIIPTNTSLFHTETWEATEFGSSSVMQNSTKIFYIALAYESYAANN